MVGITLLPTIYYLLYKNGKVGRMTKFVEKISLKDWKIVMKVGWISSSGTAKQ